MSSWCLTASDSATTAPRPPGLASRARVTSKWAIKLNSKLIKANFNPVRTIHKSALQQCIPPESAIRHTQVSDLTADFGTATNSAEFPAPIGAKAAPMPSDEGLGLDHSDRI